MLKCCVAMTLAVLATAFRVKSGVKTHGQFGEVAGLYTWGSPASAKPGLTNLRGSDPCFPGVRMVTMNETSMDAITQLARWFSFEHPLMPMTELHTSTNTTTEHACSEEAATLPQDLWGNLILHMPWKYTFHLPDHTSFIFNMSMIGCWLGNSKDFPILGTYVKEAIELLGWKLVARSKSPANWFFSGDQYSILAQHPDTLECIVTFQSTLSLRDVLIDMDMREREFCDLPGTVVHKGFRDHMRHAVEGEWQTLIRPHLPSCSKVYIAGMSLGGAVSELLTACVQRAPANDEDFRNLSWVPSTPAQLPYL